MAKRRFGWKRDLPDIRDYRFASLIMKFPPVIDLRSQCPLIVNQGNLGSCTANAAASSVMFESNKQKLDLPYPSRLFIYYNTRILENTVAYDSGASIRNTIKAIAKHGCCSELRWPYWTSKFKVKPTPACYSLAAHEMITSYISIPRSLQPFKQCLVDGYPFIFGFSVYESFDSSVIAKTGKMSMPSDSEALLGGHAVTAVGYDDNRQAFTIMNSWGPRWGDKGYFYMPYEYITNPRLAADFWTIRLINK